MFEFALPWALAAVAVPLLAAAALPPSARRASHGVFLPFFRSARAWRRRRPVVGVRAVAAALAWIALTLAAARPQWVGEPIARHLHGRDVMVAIDVSGSMAERDMRVAGGPVTRLDAVREVAAEFVARRVDDRVGLIVFGSHAYMLSPMTFDRAMVAALIDEAQVGLAGLDTALGDAIGLAVKRLRDGGARSRVLVLLSDGANRHGRLGPLEAARLAARHGLTVHTIGIGSPATGDPGTALDAATLRAVAERTGGRYFAARDATALRSVYRSIDALEPVASVAEVVRPVRELYRWPLAGALVLGALAALVPALARRRLRPVPARATR